MKIQKVNEISNMTEMEDKFKKYLDGGFGFYNSLLNFMHKKMDMFEILGKYAYENDYYPEEIKFLVDLNSPDKSRLYTSLAITLLTQSDFVIDKLKEVYGEPIYHDEFGEGFDGEYDEETDEESEPDIKESFASYFINIEGVDLHIGYDHRGLTIEAKKGANISDLIEAMKKFIEICYK